MRNTRSFSIGPLPIGGGAPVTVQSMTNTDTRDAAATLAQVRALAQAGCDIVRLSVYDEQCLEALPAIIEGSPVPLVADIHYRADLAVGAMERGIAKVRINPGNIGSVREVRRVADCAKMHHVPIRIGVNSGSVEKEILAREGGVTARGMLQSALGHARLLEEAGFHDIVLSLKASSVPLTVEAYRLAAKETDYPLHVGVTEAGLPGSGNIKRAIGIEMCIRDSVIHRGAHGVEKIADQAAQRKPRHRLGKQHGQKRQRLRDAKLHRAIADRLKRQRQRRIQRRDQGRQAEVLRVSTGKQTVHSSFLLIAWRVEMCIRDSSRSTWKRVPLDLLIPSRSISSATASPLRSSCRSTSAITPSSPKAI